MSDKAIELLSKMASEYDSSHRQCFDSYFYIGYPDSVLTELENYGYILCKSDVIGSIELTRAGYNEAKK